MVLNPKYTKIEELRNKLISTKKRISVNSISVLLGYNRATISQIINNKIEGSNRFREIVEYKLKGDFERILSYDEIMKKIYKYIDNYGIDDILYDMSEKIKQYNNKSE